MLFTCLTNFQDLDTTNLLASSTSEDPLHADSIIYHLTDTTSPTLFLFQYKQEIFGAYSESSWDEESTRNFGSLNNFIFSITRDLIYFPKEKKSGESIVYQWKDSEGLGWGETDLIVNSEVKIIFI